MGKKAHKVKKPKYDPSDDFDEWEDDFDMDELAQEISSTEWGLEFGSSERFSTRRKIERHAEMRRLRSEIAEWEEFDDHLR